MKKVWVLEKFVSVEEMQNSLKELLAMKEMNSADAEAVKTCEEVIEAYEKRMQKHPEGYWLGYQGKSNYKEFCYCAKQTMRNLAGSKFRVVKAEIEDNAKYWLGYINPVQNDGVLRYLYATI